jgi:hypothetical protein
LPGLGENEILHSLDGLAEAVQILRKLGISYSRLNPELKKALLTLIFERILMDTEGKIVVADCEFHAPFDFLAKVN